MHTIAMLSRLRGLKQGKGHNECEECCSWCNSNSHHMSSNQKPGSTSSEHIKNPNEKTFTCLLLFPFSPVLPFYNTNDNNDSNTPSTPTARTNRATETANETTAGDRTRETEATRSPATYSVAARSLGKHPIPSSARRDIRGLANTIHCRHWSQICFCDSPKCFKDCFRVHDPKGGTLLSKQHTQLKTILSHKSPGRFLSQNHHTSIRITRIASTNVFSPPNTGLAGTLQRFVCGIRLFGATLGIWKGSKRDDCACGAFHLSAQAVSINLIVSSKSSTILSILYYTRTTTPF